MDAGKTLKIVFLACSRASNMFLRKSRNSCALSIPNTAMRDYWTQNNFLAVFKLLLNMLFWKFSKKYSARSFTFSSDETFGWWYHVFAQIRMFRNRKMRNPIGPTFVRSDLSAIHTNVARLRRNKSDVSNSILVRLSSFRSSNETLSFAGASYQAAAYFWRASSSSRVRVIGSYLHRFSSLAKRMPLIGCRLA